MTARLDPGPAGNGRQVGDTPFRRHTFFGDTPFRRHTFLETHLFLETTVRRHTFLETPFLETHPFGDTQFLETRLLQKGVSPKKVCLQKWCVSKMVCFRKGVSLKRCVSKKVCLQHGLSPKRCVSKKVCLQMAPNGVSPNRPRPACGPRPSPLPRLSRLRLLPSFHSGYAGRRLEVWGVRGFIEGYAHCRRYIEWGGPRFHPRLRLLPPCNSVCIYAYLFFYNFISMLSNCACQCVCPSNFIIMPSNFIIMLSNFIIMLYKFIIVRSHIRPSAFSFLKTPRSRVFVSSWRAEFAASRRRGC